MLVAFADAIGARRALWFIALSGASYAGGWFPSPWWGRAVRLLRRALREGRTEHAFWDPGRMEGYPLPNNSMWKALLTEPNRFNGRQAIWLMNTRLRDLLGYVREADRQHLGPLEQNRFSPLMDCSERELGSRDAQLPSMAGTKRLLLTNRPPNLGAHCCRSRWLMDSQAAGGEIVVTDALARGDPVARCARPARPGPLVPLAQAVPTESQHPARRAPSGTTDRASAWAGHLHARGTNDPPLDVERALYDPTLAPVAW